MSKANKPLFNKILIANRGEIALRIIRSLDKMGITSVAVYSEADTHSLHVENAKEAYYIGNSPVNESYLNAQNILNAIRASGAEAVHPGYGFLSENSNFASMLEKEGVTLIGPTSKAIKMMGDKIIAKKIAIESGVNTVPGYMGVIDNPDQAIEIAREIGFPVIVKAAAGGGGRGMRIVRNEDDMASIIVSAKLEAQSCFDDNRVFIEKLIEKPRHIEIQILADKFGNIICLGERECSIQRHHQKVIEEAPSVILTPELRAKMYEQSKNLAKKVGYYSAGTIEFILDQNKNFFFLEMNTRLQVEHCVTEQITGLDIVEQMIKIAAGKKLEISQDDVKLKGWSIECRVYAEDPKRGFLPSSGRIIEYIEPAKDIHTRVDSGVGPGSDVAMFYDPMISKLIVHEETRELAIKKMISALGSYIIRGISHNITFLEAIISHRRFMSGDINTNFISEEYPDGFIGAELTSEITENFLATVLYIFIQEQKRTSNIQGQLDNQFHKIGTRWIVSIDGKQFPVLMKDVEGGLNIRHGSSRIFIRTNWQIWSKLFTGYVNGRYINVQLENLSTYYKLTHAGVTIRANVRSGRIAELESIMPKKLDEDGLDASQNFLIAPLSGQVINVVAQEGETVEAGKILIVLTAMKMENTLTAQKKCKIAKILVKEGELVLADQKLIMLEEIAD
ncbi:MAG: acetyl/propionyl/methylcrotonyl-CoA carboxylase subunit alpha [Rickettsiaceae bacterium]|nr:acetyl/propionyl/methylcrotonyl-CoA carboxylase subunit alpha [Rickettsiaceae bacterium]